MTILFRLLAPALAAFLLVAPGHAQTAQVLPLKGQVADDGRALVLEWPPLRGATAQVLRRELGEVGQHPWQPITPAELTPIRMTDDSIQPGIAYEYQIRLDRPGRDRPEAPRIGFWAAGTDVPAQADQGAALLVVDETIAAPLAAEITRLQSDLTGAGWQVTRLNGPRGVDDAAENLRLARDLRGQIGGWWQGSDGSGHAVILLGHLPVVSTGWVNPDGHDPQAVPSDLYYAAPDVIWPVTRSPKGQPQLLPSFLPTPARIQVGRIDFAHLGPEFGTETALLADYLNRNHRWRQGDMGDPRVGYAFDPNLQVERQALVNILGPDAVRDAGHKDSAGGGPYLLGVDFGHWRGLDYISQPPSEAAFTINFGSNKQMFDNGNNAMVALLARGNVLSVGWGGRPAWQLHGMAVGESIGQAHLRTANNGSAADGMDSRDYATTGRYDWVGAPWVNLLGDPTLKPFPLPPARDFRAEHRDDGLHLTWQLPEGATAVRLFRAPDCDGPFVPLGAGDPIAETSATDPDPLADGCYMARAEGLAQVNSGSFYRLAQGAFAATQ